MTGIGTLVNAGAVVAGGIVGLLLRKGLTKRFQQIILQGIGLSVIFIGISGAMEFMVGGSGSFAKGLPMLVVVSMVLGGWIGEALQIEGRFEQMGDFLRRKMGDERDSLFVEGFLIATMTICVGAMAIVGALQDGLQGDPTMLYTKAILDGVILIILTSSYGKGAIFSVIPLVVLQGSITFFAKIIQKVLTQPMIDSISVTGSMMIFCIGVNLMFDKKIKVANLLPGLLVAILYTAIFLS
ncbi:putative membrane protein YqgA involved in biofilm formation [Aequitasia blattaphilus]|uniref:DUF554 domain-containing protein n=1 Tax=Aequitasia blattaphilus TaxID=2949332 RepID=A0ABT1E6H2_9FIRM|nr:DUF554 domain-containing protein [Aequitasia blattaphilus]MCP1101184.1 DUF554 domain-containing protein [Aequitasia blattaphilus]MCR8613824.1 DUF554 domain-containing protein [Aequitasia blattaphilus]